jgi:hypothetical protein
MLRNDPTQARDISSSNFSSAAAISGRQSVARPTLSDDKYLTGYFVNVYLLQGLGLSVHFFFTASLFRYFIKNITQYIQIPFAIVGNVDKFL